jgi:hypothetical protein
MKSYCSKEFKELDQSIGNHLAQDFANIPEQLPDDHIDSLSNTSEPHKNFAMFTSNALVPSKVNSEKSEIATEKDDSMDPVSSHDSQHDQQQDMIIDHPADLTEEVEL